MDQSEYLSEISAAFRKRDAKRLRKIEDAVLREASLVFSKKLIYLAIIAYVLSKISSKPRFLARSYTGKMAAVDAVIESFIKCGIGCSDEQALRVFSSFEEAVKNLESVDPRFILSFISKGRLKVAATLYAQGISLGVASEATGVEKQEILSYAGHTMMFDRLKEERSVKDRVKSLRLFLEG